MEEQISNISLETEYLITLNVLRKSYEYLSRLKYELISKKKDLVEAKKDILNIRRIVNTVPIWSYVNDLKTYNNKLFVIGKKTSKNMDGKVPPFNLFEVLDRRWDNKSVVIQDIDELRNNFRNYSSKVFSMYFVLNENQTKPTV